MNIALYHIDAFTDRIFAGNAAAVCTLPKWLPEETLIQIAQENNLAATAFLVREHDDYSVRWLAPEYEIPLCGHGSIASGYVIFNVLEPKRDRVTLKSISGPVVIARDGDWIVLDFPVKELESINLLSKVAEGLGSAPKEVYGHKKERCLAVFETEEDVRQLKPDMKKLNEVGYVGVIATAPSEKIDFVSRIFYPKKAMSEDAATGSSYCLLGPYWAKRLNKNEFVAKQISPRGGDMRCKLQGDRVLVSGKAVEYMRGEIKLSLGE